MDICQEIEVVVEEVWRQVRCMGDNCSVLRTQLRDIGQALDRRFSCLLEVFGGEPLWPRIVACRLVGSLRAVWLLPRLCRMSDVAAFLVQAWAAIGRRVLLVRPAGGTAGRQCRGIMGEGI